MGQVILREVVHWPSALMRTRPSEHAAPRVLLSLVPLFRGDGSAGDAAVLAAVEPPVVGQQQAQVLFAVEAVLGGFEEVQELLPPHAALPAVHAVEVQEVVDDLLHLQRRKVRLLQLVLVLLA